MSRFSFEHPTIGAIALLAVLATIAIAIARRPAVPRATLILVAAGLLLLVTTAAGLIFWRPAAQPVAVLVDLSASTRGASYRDTATLQRRIRELLGDTPYEIKTFGEGAPSRSVLPPSDAPAILLFSDGRVVSTAARQPPTFVVIDPALENPQDTAITGLQATGDSVSVSVRNTMSTTRPLTLDGLQETDSVPVLTGAFALTRPVAARAHTISATFAPGDLWPENDSMRSVVPPPATAQRWWVGETNRELSGWRFLKPDELPREPGTFLAASVVVLDNVPAESLDTTQQSSLAQFVRNLGGGLVIRGGDRAFAAGGYGGSTLDELSPLASDPPEPTTQWLLLADASGSMNQSAGSSSRTRWQFAADALAGALNQLPPADLLSIGSFADDVRWWSRGKSVAETRTTHLPPEDVRPGGKTNLDSGLRKIAANADSAIPRHLLVATDAQASIEDASGLAAQFKSRNLTLHVLLIGDETEATALPALRTIVSATGGTIRPERLPENWAAGIRELLRAARPANLHREPIRVRFLDSVAAHPPIEISLWNQTWPKAQSTPLAETTTKSGDRIVMAARWNIGEGSAAAAAFEAPMELTEALSRLVERPPRDPRFNIAWETGSTLGVSIDAAENSHYLNAEALVLELSVPNGETMRHAIPQVSPGRYALQIDAPPHSTIAKVRRGQQFLDTRAIAERYAPEFDAVGNDRAALVELARRTGGEVIEPGVTRQLDIPWPRRPVSLTSSLALAGALLVILGLIRWRVGS